MITMALMAEKDADLEMRWEEALTEAMEELARKRMEKNRIDAMKERTDSLFRQSRDGWLDDVNRQRAIKAQEEAFRNLRV